MQTSAPGIAANGQNTDQAWVKLRHPSSLGMAERAIRDSVPLDSRILGVQHVRTAHYVACRVETRDGSWLARVGVTSPSDTAKADNSGFMGTAVTVPTGQQREYVLAREFSFAGVSVTVPAGYTSFEGPLDAHSGLDVLWLPFLQDSGAAVTAEQWAAALVPLHASRPGNELPVFTSRAKSLGRLASWADREAAASAAKEYDERLAELFGAATRWGPVHGDAHCGNILVAAKGPVLFDFDTVCWAPLAWDLTHLLVRAGTDRNTGYTVGEIREAFGFTDQEVDAAVALRLVARRIARA